MNKQLTKWVTRINPNPELTSEDEYRNLLDTIEKEGERIQIVALCLFAKTVRLSQPTDITSLTPQDIYMLSKERMDLNEIIRSASRIMELKLAYYLQGLRGFMLSSDYFPTYKPYVIR
jgi:hypothetical protein